jgi:predicted Zn-ribbon and HTH transcriptional regulator
MTLKYKDIDLDNYVSSNNKPQLFDGDTGYPLDRLNPFLFEDLTYFAIKQCIENEKHWNNFDSVYSLGGIKDKGRDCILKNNNLNLGLIQCKHSIQSKLSKPIFVKEIIKFLLYSIKEPELIDNIDEFKYYIFSSSGLSSEASELINKFNEEILKETKLSNWVNSVIKQYSTISNLKNYDNVREKLNPLLLKINVEHLTVKDFNLLLNKDYNKNIINTFYSVKKVIDKEGFTEILDSKLTNNLSYEEAIKEIKSASIDLTRINNFFGSLSNSHIERKETDLLFNWVLSDLEEERKGIAILEANAGLGKTIVLKDLYYKLDSIGIPVLSIKSDKYYANDRTALERKIFQKEDVSIESILKTISEVDQKIVLLIDQLDALSQTLSTQRDYMTTYNRLIHDLSFYPNVRIIISVRTFDLNYDSDLRIYTSKEFSNFKLNPLSMGDVKKILNDLNVNKPSIKLIELLQLPSNLNIFCKLKETSKHDIDSLKTLNDLHNALWSQLIIKSDKKNLKVKDFLYKVSNRMYEFQQITISNIFDDTFHKEVSFLKSQDIINEHNNEIQFFHQSFYDYLFAKQFVENENSLIEYIDENGQSLYVRQIIKMVIEYLREHNHPQYFETLNNILKIDKYRFHIKMLLLTSLSLVTSPTKKEKEIFKELIDKDDNLLEVFISSILSIGWINYFIDSGYLDSLLLTKNDKKHNLGFRLLVNNLSTSNSEIIEYISSISYNDRNDESLVKRLLTFCENWENEKLLTLFDNHFSFESGSSARHEDFWYFQLLERISIYHPEHSFNHLKKILNETFRDLSNMNSISYELKTLLEKIYTFHPQKTFEFLFDIMNEIVEKDKDVNQFNNHKTELYKGFYFSDVGIKSSSEDTDDEIFNILRNHIIELSNNNVDEFKNLVKKYINSNSIPILKLYSIGLNENPKIYIDIIFEIVLNIHRKNGFNGWDNKFQWLVRHLIGKSIKHFSVSQNKEITDILLSIKPNYEFKVGTHKDKKYHLLNYSGEKQYLFFNVIPKHDIYKNPRLKKRFQELQRKFGEPKEDKPKEGRIISYSVGAPYSEKVYKNMTIKNWYKSINKFNDSYKRDRFSSPSRGGTMEHARAFEKEVELRPDFFIELIFDIVNNRSTSDTYMIHGISGLINSKYESLIVLKLIKKVIEYEDLGISNTLRTVWHIEYLIENKLVDEKIIKYLSNLALNHENPSRPLNPNNPIHDSINSVRGAALNKLISCYYNKDFKDKIFEVVEKAMYDKQLSVRVSILSKLAFLNHLDLERSFLIFNRMTDTDEIGILQNSFWSADFYKNKFFERMQVFFERIIKYEELHEKGVILITKTWIYGNNSCSSYELLQKAKVISEKARCAIINTAEQALINEDEVINKRGYNLLIDLLKYEGDEMSRRYSGLVLRKFKPNTFNIVLPFLRKYVKSSHARLEPKYLFNYLNNCSNDYPLECLELIKDAMYIDERSIQNRGYFDKEPVQVVLSIYSALNKKYEQNKIRLQETLDLFDILLQNNRMRGFATDAINNL